MPLLSTEEGVPSFAGIYSRGNSNERSLGFKKFEEVGVIEVNRMRILVAYASKSGSTAEIAQAIGEELRQSGLEADVRSAEEVRDVRTYGAVVLGSAVYMGRWRREALHLGRRHASELQERPVWLFSSGPVDRSAEEGSIPPVKGAANLASRIGARGHITFGGKLTADATGWIAQSMVKGGSGGDFRNLERIRNWARGVGAEIQGTPDPAGRANAPR